MEESDTPTGVSVHTGFPNPALDKNTHGLDLNKLLIHHATSTYLFRVRGATWENSGVFDGDVAIIDRALDARNNDVVLWWDEARNEFAITIYSAMMPGATLWGVITSTIHELRKGAVHTDAREEAKH
ncbi:MAG TPA: S24 family peptidase [Patescibacteria group bacterium]|nr:S24 family peptidase [Patescibacteria group bacterium]